MSLDECEPMDADATAVAKDRKQKTPSPNAAAKIAIEMQMTTEETEKKLEELTGTLSSAGDQITSKMREGEQKLRACREAISGLFKEIKEPLKDLTKEPNTIAGEMQSLAEDFDKLSAEKEVRSKKYTSFVREIGNQEVIQIKVGNEIFTSTRKTLCKVDGLLATSLKETWSASTMQNGVLTMAGDRDPVGFRYVLNYLRDLTFICPEEPELRKQILGEADYFGVTALRDIIKEKIEKDEPAPKKKAVKRKKEQSAKKSKKRKVAK